MTTKAKSVTITISGPIGTGKTFLKYAIAKFLSKKGFKTEIEELEMKPEQIKIMMNNKKEIKKALRKSDIVYKIKESLIRELLTMTANQSKHG
jgi:DNA replication protein DnaC